MRYLIAVFLLLLPAIASAQISGPIQYDSTGQPLTPYQPVTYFGWLAPNATLPSDNVCASEISYTPPSTVNNSPIDTLNAPMNVLSPTSQQLTTFHNNPNGNMTTPVAFLPAADYLGITGAYPGLLQASTPPTTDMIIRWAACKWGIDEDTLRAQLWTESTWNAAAVGLGSSVAGSVACTGTPIAVSPTIYNTQIQVPTGVSTGLYIKNVSGCYTKWGIGQELLPNFATVFPPIKDSTAFAIDFRAAAERSCINGHQVAWFSSAGGGTTCHTPQGGHSNCDASSGLDLDQGCVASHFDNEWWSTADLGYWSTINSAIGNKPWPGGR